MKIIIHFLLFLAISDFLTAQQQWTLNFTTPTQQDIKVLSAASDDICWFMTNMDKLYKTSNGGITWVNVPQPGATSFNPSGLFVVDNNLAFKASSSALYKTVDGGASWSLVFVGGTSQTPVVRMKDQFTGVMASGGHLYKTTDGGDSWNIATVTQPPGNIQNSSGKGSLYNIGDQLWAAIQSSGIAYSPDFGNTWSMPANTGLSFSGIPHIGFGNTSLGMAITGSLPFVYVTTNGGASWTNVDNSLGSNEDVVVNGTQCWYIPNSADHFYVKYSKDSGVTWQQQLVDAAGFDVLEKARTGNRLWAGTSQGKLYTYFDSLTLIPLNIQIMAQKSGKAIRITWEDEDPYTSCVYELDKSADGNLFTKIIYVQNAPNEHKYSFLDKKPRQGNNFYRITKRNSSGAIELSEIVKLFFGTATGSIRFVDPLINGNCELFFENIPSGKYLARLITSDGRVVLTRSIIHTNNSIEKVDTGNNKGFFILQIADPQNNKINIPVLL